MKLVRISALALLFGSLVACAGEVTAPSTDALEIEPSMEGGYAGPGTAVSVGSAGQIGEP
jgi:hypothetical protein